MTPLTPVTPLARLYRPGPLDVPDWLRVLMERHRPFIVKVEDELRAQGVPEFYVVPFYGAGADRIAWCNEPPENLDAILNAQLRKKQQAYEDLARTLGIPVAEPEPEEEKVH